MIAVAGGILIAAFVILMLLGFYSMSRSAFRLARENAGPLLISLAAIGVMALGHWCS
jgi:hypothetical protein